MCGHGLMEADGPAARSEMTGFAVQPLRTSAAGGTSGKMNFKIRSASAADVPEIHAVRNGVRENRLSGATRITEASYLPYIAAHSAWVAETETGIVGFAVIDVPAASVWALFINPDAEGAGIGRALHSTMLEWAREQGIRRLSLSTENGSRAMHFYSRWAQAATTAEGEVIFEKLLLRSCPLSTQSRHSEATAA